LQLYHTGLYSLERTRDDVVLRAGTATFEKASGHFRGTPAQMQQYQRRLRRERGQAPVSALGDDGQGYVFDTEVLIRAADLARANRALNLLIAAMAVNDMGIQFVPEIFDNKLIEYPAPAPRPFAISSGEGLLRACVLASRAGRSRRLQYALHRLTLSYRSISPHWIDLDPSHSPRKFGVHGDPMIHVYIANAITLAYSAIEDMGLEVRSHGRPSKMHDGTWNTPIREDLESRLRKSKINLSEREIWTMRGPRTGIERRKKPPAVKKASWSRGGTRDVELELIDAIALASWLRDKVGAHGLPSYAASLTVYDAHNAQSVARRLLMESVGLWAISPT
jgi:hypothetical protein